MYIDCSIPPRLEAPRIPDFVIIQVGSGLLGSLQQHPNLEILINRGELNYCVTTRRRDDQLQGFQEGNISNRISPDTGAYSNPSP